MAWLCDVTGVPFFTILEKVKNKERMKNVRFRKYHINVITKPFIRDEKYNFRKTLSGEKTSIYIFF